MLMNLPQIMKSKAKPKMMRFKPIKVSRQTELWYSRQLLAEVKALRSQVEGVLRNPTSQSPFLLDDNSFVAFSTQQMLGVIKKLAETDRTSSQAQLAQAFVQRANQQNAREVGENLKRQTGVDLQGMLNNSPVIAEKLAVMTEANVQLIKSIRSQYLDKVQTIISQGVISGKLNRDIAKEIRDLGGVTENRARFIARDQSAKLNAALTQARHEEVGITKYRWSTSGDERVRDSHLANDGKIFSYNAPPETGHPGQDFNCRCVAIPVIDERAERQTATGGYQGAQHVVEKEQPISETTTKLIDQLKANNVEHRPVQLLKKALTGDQIIAKLAGGDETKGSCASLALAYIGNRIGLDVTDYRGGKSCEFFASGFNLWKILTMQGVKSSVYEVIREAKDTAVILAKELALGKEYILAAGEHASIVRRSDKGLEYLELQDPKDNGWTPFTKRHGSNASCLEKRFGCKVRRDRYGFNPRIMIAEIDSFQEVRSDMKAMLGYLNTATDKQKKGNKGYAK